MGCGSSIIIPQGQRYAVWKQNGRMVQVEGPERLFLWRDRAEKLTKYTADPHEYLVVRFQDGRKKHLKGYK
jgi:hypothetical protein